MHQEYQMLSNKFEETNLDQHVSIWSVVGEEFYIHCITIIIETLCYQVLH
jgi:hypothetical protein